MMECEVRTTQPSLITTSTYSKIFVSATDMGVRVPKIACLTISTNGALYLLKTDTSVTNQQISPAFFPTVREPTYISSIDSSSFNIQK